MANQSIQIESLKYFIEEIYDQIAMRPQMLSGNVESIEAFVFGMEMILDHLLGDERPAQYNKYRSPDQFGCEGLIAMFTRLHHCRLLFVKIEDGSRIPADEFQVFFENHWAAFLQHRRELMSQGETGDAPH